MERTTAIVQGLIAPIPGDRLIHGNASFTSAYLLRALDVAEAENAGLALIHSHPRGRGWQEMSRDDTCAELGYAAQVEAVTRLPLVGLTIAGDGTLSARRWPRGARGQYERDDACTVRVCGERLVVTYHPTLAPAPPAAASQRRTVSAWGAATQAILARLHVGIVGAGSVGTMVAEALARTGVERITLIDFDTVEEKNLDRSLHFTLRDVGKAKVSVLQRALVLSATARQTQISAHELSVVEPAGHLVALDCDVLFSCVDRPWPRQVMNTIAYAHLIPVVDGGIRVDRAASTSFDPHWRAHVAAPGRRCLECLGQYDPADVAIEREGHLDDPSYLAALPAGHVVERGENVFAFSLALAGLEVGQFLSMVAAPGGVSDIGAQHYHASIGQLSVDSASCTRCCPYSAELVGLGDLNPYASTGVHLLASMRRAARSSGT